MENRLFADSASEHCEFETKRKVKTARTSVKATLDYFLIAYVVLIPGH